MENKGTETKDGYICEQERESRKWIMIINLSNLTNQTYNKESFLEICQQVFQSDGAMEVVLANIASGMTKEKYDNMLAYLTAYSRTTQELKTA